VGVELFQTLEDQLPFVIFEVGAARFSGGLLMKVSSEAAES
jgi:hypothetical protein